MVGNVEFEKTVIAHLRDKFQIGSEDRNDVTFVGQRIQWKGKPGSPGSFIKVDQKLAIELREVDFGKHLTDNIVCNPSLHTEYRSVLGQKLTGYNITHVTSFLGVLLNRQLPQLGIPEP